jgi:protein-disulfide isomerase
MVALIAVAAAAVAAVVHFTTQTPAPVAVPTGPAPVEPGGKARGRADAPVTIEVYSDFLCSHCADFALDTERAIIAEFVEPGIARLVYKHFPVIAPLSALIAEASECAADQHRFWAFHDAVFARAARRGMTSPADIDAAARDARLDVNALDACRRSGQDRGRVEQDFRDGTNRGVEGTPTVFVNGRKIVGNQPIEVFRAEINAARQR